MKNDTVKNGVIIVLVLLLVIGGSFFTSELTRRDDSVPASSEQKEHTPIGISEYLALKKGEEKAIIYIGRPTCSACKMQDPHLKNVAAEYNLTVYYLNTDELTAQEHSQLMASDSYFNNGYGTPLLLIVQHDQIMDLAQGARGKADLITFFQTNGFIGE